MAAQSNPLSLASRDRRRWRAAAAAAAAAAVTALMQPGNFHQVIEGSRRAHTHTICFSLVI